MSLLCTANVVNNKKLLRVLVRKGSLYSYVSGCYDLYTIVLKD